MKVRKEEEGGQHNHRLKLTMEEEVINCLTSFLFST